MEDELPLGPEDGRDPRVWTLGGILRLALADGAHENWARSPTAPPPAGPGKALTDHQDCRAAGAICSNHTICHEGGTNSLPLCGFRAAHLAAQQHLPAVAPLPLSGAPAPLESEANLDLSTSRIAAGTPVEGFNVPVPTRRSPPV